MNKKEINTDMWGKKDKRKTSRRKTVKCEERTTKEETEGKQWYVKKENKRNNWHVRKVRQKRKKEKHSHVGKDRKWKK